MSDRDRLNLLSILDSTQKILEYTNGYSNVEEFAGNQRDFDTVMMNFVVIGEMVNRLTDQFADTPPHSTSILVLTNHGIYSRVL